jgi:hypothetical protein
MIQLRLREIADLEITGTYIVQHPSGSLGFIYGIPCHTVLGPVRIVGPLDILPVLSAKDNPKPTAEQVITKLDLKEELEELKANIAKELAELKAKLTWRVPLAYEAKGFYLTKTSNRPGEVMYYKHPGCKWETKIWSEICGPLPIQEPRHHCEYGNLVVDETEDGRFLVRFRDSGPFNEFGNEIPYCLKCGTKATKTTSPKG